MLYENNSENEEQTYRKFLILFFVGFFIILTGVVLLIISALSSGEPINFGGVILIWPFPIIIGAGPEAKWMVLFALILTFFMFLIFLIFYRKTGKP